MSSKPKQRHMHPLQHAVEQAGVVAEQAIKKLGPAPSKDAVAEATTKAYRSRLAQTVTLLKDVNALEASLRLEVNDEVLLATDLAGRLYEVLASVSVERADEFYRAIVSAVAKTIREIEAAAEKATWLDWAKQEPA